jgi:uncharacterized SAM-binding protein YcdF (DUF218 family)
MNTSAPSPCPEERPTPLRRQIARGARVAVRWSEHVLASGAVLFIVLCLSPLPGKLYAELDRQDPLRSADYIICLGGTPSRIIESARLMSEGYAGKLVVSNNPMAAPMMRSTAIEWGAPADHVMIDNGSYVTADHPYSIERTCGVDPERDTVIIVTSYAHMARAKACFVKAGYRHIIMHEPRWERRFRHGEGIKRNLYIVPELIYEGAALLDYWATGRI